jgi:hypothetical protein
MSRLALGFLLLRSLRNRTRQQARRLRQPRYAVALLVGLGYLALLARNNSSPRVPVGMTTDLLQLGIAGGLLLMVAWTWISATRNQVLAYTEAEVMFLFPAPISRRALMRYKLLRSQVVILLSTLLWVAILGAGRGELAAPLRAIALWCLFTTIYLHRVAAALTRSSTIEHGSFGVRRHPVLLGVLAVAMLLGVGALLQAGNRLMALPTDSSPLVAIREALAAPLVVILLAPFRLAAHPLAAISGSEWMRSMPWALALLALHYVWVIRSDLAFEEAAADASFARARQLAARQAGTAMPNPQRKHSLPLVRLVPLGPPAHAILWKNVTMLLRRARLRTWSMIALVVAFTLIVASVGLPSAAEAAGTLLLVWGGFFFALGPQWIRNDLRTDLAHLELLRSYPVEPDAVVRMEAAASALLLSLSQLTLLLLGALALTHVSYPTLPRTSRLIMALAAILVLPAINFVGMLLQNGAALLFPGWVRVGLTRGGVETLGQSMLTALAYMAALGLASIVPMIGAVGIVVMLHPWLGAWAALPAALGSALLLVAEGWLLSLWLGTVYERLDPLGAGVESA